MRHCRHSIATCAALLCLTLTVGCGSNTTAQFKTGYAAARVPLNRTFVEVSRAFHRAKGKTVTQIGDAFSSLAGRFGNELGPLEALKPPPSVKTAFATLTSSLRRVKRDLQQASAELKAGNVDVGAHWLERLTSDADDATDAASSITRTLGNK